MKALPELEGSTAAVQLCRKGARLQQRFLPRTSPSRAGIHTMQAPVRWSQGKKEAKQPALLRVLAFVWHLSHSRCHSAANGLLVFVTPPRPTAHVGVCPSVCLHSKPCGRCRIMGAAGAAQNAESAGRRLLEAPSAGDLPKTELG